MLNKIRNILLILLSFVLTSVEARAQGVVSLSEEAMFEDELDTTLEKPGNGKETNSEVPVAVGNEIGAKEIKPAAEDANLPNLEISAPKAKASFENVSASSEDSKASRVLLEDENSDLYKTIDGQTALNNADIFEHMSDIEKRNAILNMELRREQLQDNIEAVKYKRREAVAREKQKEEEQRLKNLEAEKEIERKLVVEQEKLRELDIKFEKLRQEKILAAYKNKMLEETQKWIEHDGAFYKQINDLRDAKMKMAEDIKTKMAAIQEKTAQARDNFVAKVTDYEKKLEDKDSQIDILRTRIDKLEKEREEAKRNPFAGFDKEQLAAAAGIDISVLEAFTNSEAFQNASMQTSNSEPVETDLSKLYGVTEIRGKGNELVARLVNQNGTAFYVKRGTALQSGHIIEKITTTYVMANKAGDRQYLYFSAGGILPTEVSGLDITKTASDDLAQ